MSIQILGSCLASAFPISIASDAISRTGRGEIFRGIIQHAGAVGFLWVKTILTNQYSTYSNKVFGGLVVGGNLIGSGGNYLGTGIKEVILGNGVDTRLFFKGCIYMGAGSATVLAAGTFDPRSNNKRDYSGASIHDLLGSAAAGGVMALILSPVYDYIWNQVSCKKKVPFNQPLVTPKNHGSIPGGPLPDHLDEMRDCINSTGSKIEQTPVVLSNPPPSINPGYKPEISNAIPNNLVASVLPINNNPPPSINPNYNPKISNAIPNNLVAPVLPINNNPPPSINPNYNPKISNAIPNHLVASVLPINNNPALVNPNSLPDSKANRGDSAKKIAPSQIPGGPNIPQKSSVILFLEDLKEVVEGGIKVVKDVAETGGKIGKGFVNLGGNVINVVDRGLEAGITVVETVGSMVEGITDELINLAEKGMNAAGAGLGVLENAIDYVGNGVEKIRAGALERAQKFQSRDEKSQNEGRAVVEKSKRSRKGRSRNRKITSRSQRNPGKISWKKYRQPS